MSGDENNTGADPDYAARELTYRDVRPLVERIVGFVCQDQELIGDLLALLAVAAYSKERGTADFIYSDARNALMPYTFSASKAVNAFVCDKLAALKGEG